MEGTIGAAQASHELAPGSVAQQQEASESELAAQEPCAAAARPRLRLARTVGPDSSAAWAVESGLGVASLHVEWECDPGQTVLHCSLLAANLSH